MHRDERRACCPQCGQLLLGVRAGVALGPFKSRIFDAVERAGRDGINSDDLFDLIYRDRPSGREALKSNVHLINELLVSTDYRIRGSRGTEHVYRLVRE